MNHNLSIYALTDLVPFFLFHSFFYQNVHIYLPKYLINMHDNAIIFNYSGPRGAGRTYFNKLQIFLNPLPDLWASTAFFILKASKTGLA